jgi:hypothetical protein
MTGATCATGATFGWSNFRVPINSAISKIVPAPAGVATTQSRSQHILELARDLLDDIELSRTTAEGLILKASRLARWVGNDETRYWLALEMEGYNSTDPISRKYMSITGRWTDSKNNKGWWGPLAQQESAMAEKAKLASMRIPDSSSDYFNIAVRALVDDMSRSANLISTLSRIKTRVLGQLHKFVSDVYYEKEFDNLSESIFERYKRDVDTLIYQHCGDVLEKIPAVMDRLAEGDQEAVSQGLMTCRRIIESFADSIYPPTDETIEIGGNTLKLDASRHQNRINAYIYLKTESQSVKHRLPQDLGNLFDRVSTGVHNDINADEARSLFLNTYSVFGRDTSSQQICSFSVPYSAVLIFQNPSSPSLPCKRSIEMTPLCKIEVTHPRVLGSREVRRGGVVDEQAGVQPS